MTSTNRRAGSGGGYGLDEASTVDSPTAQVTIGGDALSDRKIWLGTSWKMNKTIGEAIDYLDRLLPSLPVPGVQPFVAPPHTAIAAVRAHVPTGSPLLVGAQNAHWADEGAGTGEISMRMVRDAGAEFVEIGHSERRQLCGETDEIVANKVRAALNAGLSPLVCVGEHASIRDQGDEIEFVLRQSRRSLSMIERSDVRQVILAYEPVWAIGNVGREASAAEVEPVMHAIRAALPDLRALLFGGSVHTGNARTLLEDPATDGLFVGRAAWDVAGYLELLNIGSEVARRRRYV